MFARVEGQPNRETRFGRAPVLPPGFIVAPREPSSKDAGWFFPLSIDPFDVGVTISPCDRRVAQDLVGLS